jgi:hypothetical protein
MRIATWNLERGRPRKDAGQRQLDILRPLDPDVSVLTEPSPAVLALTDEAVVSDGPGDSSGSPWVAIWGSNLRKRAAGALWVAADVEISGQTVMVFGSVLPWLSAPSHVPELAGDRSSEQFFVEELDQQVAKIKELAPKESGKPVIWAGDFNQTLVGPLWGGSALRRERLQAALAELGLEAWNRCAPHALAEMFTIDLICGPAGIAVQGSETIDNATDGRVLSDHAGYVVDLRFP